MLQIVSRTLTRNLCELKSSINFPSYFGQFLRQNRAISSTINFGKVHQPTLNSSFLPSFNQYGVHQLIATPASLLSLTNNLLEMIPHKRNVTKFSLTRGKRKTVRAVLKRFKRLDWGIWIRTRCGRHKKLWKKSSALKKRLREHVFVNATQSTLLDKMVTKYWRRPHYYVDDPYRPYHSREEFPITRRKPIDYNLNYEQK